MGKVIARLSGVVLAVVITCGISSAKYSGGTGELNDPYLITTPNDLNAIGTEPNDWDKHFKMIADIDLSGFTGTQFNIIGSSSPYFSGIFDGNGFSVIEFTYDSNDEDYVGLFGVIDSTEAVVKDLLLENPSVAVNSDMFSYGGALVGSVSSGSIMRCKISGGQVTGDSYLGGLVGFMDNGLVKDCNVTCVVTGSTAVGGIVGKNSGRIMGCHFDGDVSGLINIGGIAGENDDYVATCSSSGTVTIVYSTSTRHQAGGLVGENRATVCFSQSSATVTGGERMGGLVGSNYFAEVYESYAAATVSGSNRLGGLIGNNHYSVVTNCYALGSVSGNAAIGGLIGNNDSGSTGQRIEHCYSAAYVSGSTNVGGLIGYDYSSRGNFIKCFWDYWVNPSMGGIGNSTDPDVIGETTFNMKLRATYESAGWNFVTPIWAIKNTVEYPKLWWQVFASGYGGGSGTPQDPYLILTAEQLNTIARDFVNLDKHFKLMANIDLSIYTGDQFNTIGDYDNPFTGSLDGNGHTISNFTYITTLASDVGLFGYISGEDSEIRNLTLLSPEVRTSEPIGWGTGAIAGDFDHGRIENCHVIGGSVQGNNCVGGLIGGCNADMYECSSSCSVSGDASVGGLVGGCSSKVVSLCHATGNVSGNYRVGGLFGDNYASSMYECWADTNVSGTRHIGGLIGENHATVVMNCYSKGQATASIEDVGGFIGINYGQVRNCYSFCSVSGGENAGGFCGNNSGNIENCYSTGAVTGGPNAEGFVGINTIDATSHYCFWDVETSGQPDDGGELNGIGKTTEQMQSLQTFLIWGCDAVWTIDDGNDYPRLIWENVPGRLIQKTNYGGGSGTLNDPYLIYDAEQLSLIALAPCDADKHFKLMADIDMITVPPSEYVPIGNDIQPFQGVFDGNGHSIDNFQLVCEGTGQLEGYGLFGYVYGPNAHIKNVHMSGPKIHVTSGGATGALAGIFREGTISNCTIEDANIQAGNYVGILAGYTYSQKITSVFDSSVTGIVSGGNVVGGLVGYWVNGSIINCHTSTHISGRDNIGALAGYAGCTLTACSAKGDVYATGDEVGGLCGYLSGSCSHNLADCNVYSTGDSVGGLVGNNRATVFDCFSEGTVSGGNNVGGFIGNNTGDVNDCHSESSVFGSEYVGGLIGNNWSSVVQSYAEAVVDGYRRVGGLLGHNQSYAQVSLCYANSTVHGYRDVGGFVGGNFAYTYTSLENCYAAGDVTGTEQVGGFVGYNDNLIYYCYSMGQVSAPNEVGGFAGDSPGCILACYWDTQTSGLTSSSGGVGKTTAQMKQPSTYLDWESQKVWTIDAGIDYPRLLWEGKPGTEIVDQKYFNGQGSRLSPYLIENADQLNTIGLVPSTWNKHFVLTADIDLSGIVDNQYNVIGKKILPFNGTFDGKGHKILNFNYRHPSEEEVGIFGCINDSNALIQDITMLNVDINDPAGYWIAPLVGYLYNGTVRNCHVRNAKVSGGSTTGGLGGSVVGGLIGSIGGIVIDCSSQAKVSGFQVIGGFAGSVGDNGHVFRCSSISDVAAYFPGGGFVGTNRGVIEQSSVEGIVSGYMWIGGFAGNIERDGSILNCYANVSTAGEKQIGGLVGYAWSPYNISCSYSSGSVSGDEDIGGLVGYGGYLATDSFWDVNTSGVDISSGGIGLTTEQMQSLNTYLNASWDFNDIWSICEGTGYPKFEWEILEADYLCPDGVDFVDYAFLADHWLQTEYGDVNGIELTADGRIDYKDFAAFAYYWGQTNCGYCGGVDYTGDNNVNYIDLNIFSIHWLKTDYGDCDRAEITYDGIVDSLDLAKFCENWLKGLGP